MKTRNDFVTNSSSSSFIISMEDVTHGELLDILLEITQRESEEPWGRYLPTYTYDDVTGDGVGDYHIKEYTNESYWAGAAENTEYTNVYVISNEDGHRYNFDVVESVLGEHDLPLIIGRNE